MALTEEQKEEIGYKISMEGMDYYFQNYAEPEEYKDEEYTRICALWDSVLEETEKWISENGIDEYFS